MSERALAALFPLLAHWQNQHTLVGIASRAHASGRVILAVAQREDSLERAQ